MNKSLQTEEAASKAVTHRRAVKKSYKTNLQKRLALIFILVAAALLALIITLVRIVSTEGDEYSRNVLRQQNYSSSPISFRRGAIKDRNGAVLAISERQYIMILDPTVILANGGRNESATLDALTKIYGFDREDLKSTIESKPDSAYIRYKKEISEADKNAFLDYKQQYNSAKEENRDGLVTGVWFETEYKRVYPLNDLACTVLGFSGSDASRGNWGIEEYYNDELVGKNGLTYGYINSDGIAERTTVEPENGNDVISTFDYTIQKVVENAVKKFTADKRCANLGVVVMDPNTAEILALSTDKFYDLNNPTDITAYYPEEEQARMTDTELADARAQVWRNFAVADAYEPGSTAKPFTVAAALEEAAVKDDSEYECTGKKIFGSGANETTIKCNHTHGIVNLTESLMYSCNSAMMDISAKLDKEFFTEFQTTFGFGRQTNVDLPGETSGLVYTADNMGVTDLATNSFGQNFNVNMIQMAAAFSSLVNGGYYYQPHIVKSIVSSDGSTVKEMSPILVRKTVSERTCEFVKNALRMTVESGTGSNAAISGYEIGGKTGTAQKHPRSERKYVTSFVGFAPVDNPKVLVYVVIDDLTLAEDETVSAKYAIELEREIMEQVLPYLGVPCSEEVTAPIVPIIPSDDSSEQVPEGGIISGEDDKLPESEAETEEVTPVPGYEDDPNDETRGIADGE